MAILKPTETRLSPHFLLSDFMGNHSVYTKGLINVFDKQGNDIRLDNARALCENALEPVLADAGPISISYGFISPELSQRIVTYMDPTKPSHHRWDLGAAADICVHNWVQPCALQETFEHRTGAPIEYALLRMSDMPISRLISYSESPFFCVAVSADEVAKGAPRMAWYENLYEGKPRVKPYFRKLGSDRLREQRCHDIMQDGFEYDWRGAGYPTHHGGGIRQLQHVRVSKYTMVSDWLFDEYFLRAGIRNQPMMGSPKVREAFTVAGMAYDKMVEATGVPRFSIVSAYTAPDSSDRWIEGRDWVGDDIVFEIVLPEYLEYEEFTKDCAWLILFGFLRFEQDDDRVIVTASRQHAKNTEGFEAARSFSAEPATRRLHRRRG